MTRCKKFCGVVPPVVTPVHPDGCLDEASVARLTEHLVAGGVDGVFILGTTGECASVPIDSRLRFIQRASDCLRGRVPLYVGIGDNCLASSLELGSEAFRRGADAVVAHLPSYFTLEPEEMFVYYTSLANCLPGPLLVYNIPATTHMSIPIDVIERLTRHPSIVGFKDSENDPGRLETAAHRLGGHEGFSLFVGASVLSVRGLLLGMDGVVPASGNIDPCGWHLLYEAARCGKREEAERMQERMNRLAMLFQRRRTLGQSLAALKAALNVLGLCSAEVLPPLRALQPVEIDSLRQEMETLGLTPLAESM